MFKKKEKLPPKLAPIPTGVVSTAQILQGLDKMQADLAIPPTDCNISFWHSTGLVLLDQALGGHGLPGGRYAEFSGLEGVGKSTLALEVIRVAQQAGGIGIYIDLEVGMDEKMARDVAGVDTHPDKWRLVRPQNAEQGLNYADQAITAMGRAPTVPMVLVVDSIPSLVPQAELALRYEDEAQMAGVSRLVSKFLRHNLLRLSCYPNVVVILINHLITEFATNRFARPVPKTSGGRALAYYPTVKLRFERGENYTKGIGDKKYHDSRAVNFVIWKNRVGPEQRVVTVPFNLSTDHLDRPVGFDDAKGCLDFLIAQKVLMKSGGGRYFFLGDEKKFTLSVLSAKYRDEDVFRNEVQAMVRQAVLTRWAAPGVALSDTEEELEESPDWQHV